MPGFDAPKTDSFVEPASAKNTRLGLILFTLYLIVYALFVVLSAFWPDALAVIVFGSVNLGIVYGLSLIGSAFLLALLYVCLCEPTGNDRDRPVVP